MNLPVVHNTADCSIDSIEGFANIHLDPSIHLLLSIDYRTSFASIFFHGRRCICCPTYSYLQLEKLYLQKKICKKWFCNSWVFLRQQLREYFVI